MSAMSRLQWMEYLVSNFTLSRGEIALIENILDYVKVQGLTDREEERAMLHALLDNTIGLEEQEIDCIDLWKGEASAVG